MGNKNRGSGTHGRGSSKKGRGAGNRGGRGKAGLGKKATHHKVQAVKKGGHLGEKGFKRPREPTETINLRDIDQRIDEFVEQGTAEQNGESYVFHAEDAGYDKVLGAGRLTKSIDVEAPAFSASAERKIEDNGNEAVATESDDADSTNDAE